MESFKYAIKSERKKREDAMVEAGWTTLKHLESLDSLQRTLLHQRWIVITNGRG